MKHLTLILKSGINSPIFERLRKEAFDVDISMLSNSLKSVSLSEPPLDDVSAIYDALSELFKKFDLAATIITSSDNTINIQEANISDEFKDQAMVILNRDLPELALRIQFIKEDLTLLSELAGPNDADFVQRTNIYSGGPLLLP